MDLVDLPVVVIIKIASFLNELEIIHCCHVNTAWYRTFNHNYVLKNCLKIPSSNFNSEELEKVAPKTEELEKICTHFEHCHLLRSFLINWIAVKNLFHKRHKRLEILKKLEEDLNRRSRKSQHFDELTKLQLQNYKRRKELAKAQEELTRTRKELIKYQRELAKRRAEFIKTKEEFT